MSAGARDADHDPSAEGLRRAVGREEPRPIRPVHRLHRPVHGRERPPRARSGRDPGKSSPRRNPNWDEQRLASRLPRRDRHRGATPTRPRPGVRSPPDEPRSAATRLAAAPVLDFVREGEEPDLFSPSGGTRCIALDTTQAVRQHQHPQGLLAATDRPPCSSPVAGRSSAT